jgi:hypothetical protein
VLSLPYRLRYLLDHDLCRAVLAGYARALLAFQRRRAARCGISDGYSGCVTVIQRFGRRGRDAGADVTPPDLFSQESPAPAPGRRTRVLLTLTTAWADGTPFAF